MPQIREKHVFRKISDFGLTTKNLRGLAEISPFLADWGEMLRKKS